MTSSDALDEYAVSLTATAHPPNECGDPYSCPVHGEQYRTYFAGGSNMTSLYVLGVDPGETTGFAGLSWQMPEQSPLCDPAVANAVGWQLVERQFAQCSAGTAPVFLAALLGNADATYVGVQIESFVVGARAARLRSAGAGRRTRELVNELSHLASVRTGQAPYLRPAGHVKPWATNERLAAAGLMPSGMTHSRDAARHALFASVRYYGAPDPLSRKANPA